MNFRWVDDSKTVVTDGHKYIPVDDLNMDWIELKQKIEAGEIVIKDAE